MTATRFALLGAVLGAAVAALWVIAYNSGHDLSDSEIKPHAVVLIMLAGAVGGLFVFGIVGEPTCVRHRSRRTTAHKLDPTETLNEDPAKA